MLDVLFVTPTLTRDPLKEPLGPVTLSTILRQEQISVEILSFGMLGDPHKDYSAFFQKGIQMILEKQPKILSFYTRCDCYHIMLLMAEQIKEKLGCYIVFAGPQADIIATETLEEIPWVDYICRGEGENTVYPFFASLLKGEPDLSVDGLVFRSDGEVKSNPRPEFIKDLDVLPIPDFSVVPGEVRVDPKTCFSIDVGRGCPFGCTYCSTKTFWGRKYRLKSPERIVREVKHFSELYGLKYFAFEHDMFTMDRKRVLEVCRMLRELDGGIRWNCSARVDCIDEEMVQAMADSGMRWIYLGIETGSPRMQKLINKNLKLETVLPMIRFLSSLNIGVATSFIYGFPQETYGDLSQTLALMIDLMNIKNVQINYHLCAFLPGTALGEEYGDRLTPAEVHSDQAGDIGVVECEDFMKRHPRLFLQYKEYRTELRSKAAYFTTFLNVFNSLKPAYLYYARQYDRENMIQMYLDFVEDYKEILTAQERISENEKVSRIIASDKFAKRFAHLPLAARAEDVIHWEATRRSVQRGAVPSATQILSFHPGDLQTCGSLEEIKDAWTMVTVARDKDGMVQTFVRRM